VKSNGKIWIYDKETHKIMPEEEFGIALRVRAEEKARKEMVEQALGEFFFPFDAVMRVSYISPVFPANLTSEELLKKNTPKQPVPKSQVETDEEGPMVPKKQEPHPDLPPLQPKENSSINDGGRGCFSRGRSASLGALGQTFNILLHFI
jgi:hypothetical protein